MIAEYDDTLRVYKTCPDTPYYLSRDYQYLYHKVLYDTRYFWQSNLEREKRVNIIERGIELRALGHIHRRTPVPGTGRYRKDVHRRTIHGLSHEHRSDEVCYSEYRDLNLVRAKRRYSVSKSRGWYWGFRENHFNSQRGWKRTKKRKQYL